MSSAHASGILAGPLVLKESPETIVVVLRSAGSATPDARLPEVLEAFRRHWLAIGRKRWPGRDDVEDAVQVALVKLVAPERLAQLADPARLAAWARSLFVNAVLDLARESGRHDRRRAYLGDADAEDPEEALRDRIPTAAPGPEEMLAYRERLEIVRRCTEKLDVARLKFLEDRSDKEIAALRGLSRDAVAGQLKRIRKGLRTALGEDD